MVTQEEKEALLKALDEDDRPKTGLITSMIIHYLGLMMVRKEG